jgi:hypothetical protein
VVRPALRTVVLLATVMGLLALPTVPSIGSPPAMTVAQVAVELTGVGRPATIDTHDVVSLTAEIDDRDIEVRWQDAAGWSPWVGLSAAGEHAPDPGSAEAGDADPGVSEPVWIGDADVAQLRASDAGRVDVELVTADGDLGYRADATPPATATAFTVWPPIVPRSAWDPGGDCRPRGTRDVAPAVERVFVHHTVVFPHYAPEEGDDVVRAICMGHVNHRGFSDVGYNFLIDRYGVIYQGRAGGILNAVEGAHAQGFNHGSAGIAIVGDFDETTVPPAAARALDRLTAWLVDLHGIDALGHGTAVSTGGPSTQFAEGVAVDLPNIVGHRDTALNSSCPGDHLYDIVRGSNPLAPRVRARLTSDYGYPAHGAAGTDAVAPIPVPAAVPADPPPAVTPGGVLRTVNSMMDGWRHHDVGTLVTRMLSGAAIGAAPR